MTKKASSASLPCVPADQELPDGQLRQVCPEIQHTRSASVRQNKLTSLKRKVEGRKSSKLHLPISFSLPFPFKLLFKMPILFETIQASLLHIYISTPFSPHSSQNTGSYLHYVAIITAKVFEKHNRSLDSFRKALSKCEALRTNSVWSQVVNMEKSCYKRSNKCINTHSNPWFAYALDAAISDGVTLSYLH